ncbi:hypothetical protein AB0K40_11985 [Nonomuraea bangladeshensis]|uniref:Uncharacterized protein n=1 Tax=Nonomuraea bangladeshensis TaxID=404385 RepID=A0ABV3H0Z5_9ACTN
MITKPPGWLYLTVLSASACVILYWAGVPHWYVIEMMLVAFFFGVPLCVIWLFRFGLTVSRGAIDGRIGRWVLPWVIAGGVVGALVVDAPFWLRFTISKPNMEAYAQTVTRQTDRDFPCQWVGLYRICDAFPCLELEKNAEDVPGSACLIAEEWAVYSNTNFVLLSKGEPEETANDTYRHLTGRWYGWRAWDYW